jgi:hypothetical protein
VNSDEPGPCQSAEWIGPSLEIRLALARAKWVEVEIAAKRHSEAAGSPKCLFFQHVSSSSGTCENHENRGKINNK